MIIFSEQIGKVKHFIVASQRKVYAMSIDRHTFIQKIQSMSEPIVEHICKCVLYPDSPNYKHWIEEIADFACRHFGVRKHSFKITKNMVMSNMFQEINDRNDAWVELRSFYRRFQRQNRPYPSVNISFEQGLILFDVYREIADSVSEYLVNSFDEETAYGDLQVIIRRTLKKYC